MTTLPNDAPDGPRSEATSVSRPLAVIGILLSLPSVVCVPTGVPRYYQKSWPGDVTDQPLAIWVMLFHVAQTILGLWLLLGCAALLQRWRTARGIVLGYSVAAVLFGLVGGVLVFRLFAGAARNAGSELQLGVPGFAAIVGWAGGLVLGAVWLYSLTRPGARTELRGDLQSEAS